jgi:transposase
MEDTSAVMSLPDDPAALKSIIMAITRQRDDVSRQRDEWEVKFLRAEMELLRLRKWYYGPRADRLKTPGEVAQLLLEFATELEARPLDPQDLPPDMAPAAASDLPQRTTVRRVRRGRRNLASFDNLPVTRHVHDLSNDQKLCPCCGRPREKCGQEVTWQVEYIPGHFERLEHVQVRYACKACDNNGDGGQIVLADKPQQPIDKGMAGPGLLAYIVTSKYADYLPLYRLEAIFQRNGFEIDRATQSVWCADVADLLRPLYQRMVRRVLESHLVCTDDTIMPMLAPPCRNCRKARMWVYIGDEHNPYNVFDFTLGRGREGPLAFLKGYKQTLLADAYGGYDGVVVGNDITRAGCWAHARRKFVDADKSQPRIAAEAVGFIKRLYAIEDQARAADARLALRQSESVPLLAAFKDKLHGWRDQLLPKHPMAQAIAYALNQWPELNVFASDGAVPIDNNVSEREMKRVVLNRKNSLFVGNQRGGRTAAVLSSLTSTCRRHAIDPQHYLTQLLTNLPATPISQLDQWLPDRWKHTHAAPDG